MVNGNGPIVGAEFSSEEWGIETRLHAYSSVHNLFVNQS
jgi:hypothetical protein